MSIEHSLCSVIATDRDQMACAGRAESILHIQPSQTFVDHCASRGGLVKVRLCKVVTECAQHHRKCEDENPSRLGRTPGKDNAHNCHAGRNAERNSGKRDARSELEAKELSQGEWNKWHHRISRNER